MRWQSEEHVGLNEAAEWARHFGQLEGDMDVLLARLFGIDDELVRRWSHPGRYVSGPEIAELLLHNTHLNSQQLAELYDRQFASKWPSLVIKRLSAAEVATPGAFTAPDAR